MMRGTLLATGFIAAAVATWQLNLPSMTAVFDQLSSMLPLSSDPGDSPAYRTEVVGRGDIIMTVQAAGTLNARLVVDVGSQLSGRVKEIYADFNSKVTAGQVIARVEPETYEARVVQAQAELEMARTQVAVQRAQIERSRAELEDAKAKHASARALSTRADVALELAAQEVERKRPLAERKIISASEWERDINTQQSAEAQATSVRAEEMSQAAAVGAARASLSMAEAQLANTLAQVKQKEAMLRQAQIDLDRTYIRAPVTGTVINRAISGGQTVAASLQTPILFTIAQDLTQMQVEASVVEADISRFAVGQPVTFTVDAYPEQVFTGTVRQIRKAPQVVQNVVTYIVVIAAENSKELLLPGMTANLQVIVAKRENILKVSNAALRFRPISKPSEEAGLLATPAETGKPKGTEAGVPGQVLILGPGGKPKAIPLRLGITDGRVTEVVAGDLTAGQLVITGSAAASGRDDEGSTVLVRFRLR